MKNKKQKKQKIDIDSLIPAEVVRVKGKKKADYKAYLWLLPALVLLLIFNFIPPIISFITSFTKSPDGVTFEKFVGFANYGAALSDGLFWRSFGNVFIITIVQFIFTHIANLLLAELIVNLRFKKLSSFYRIMLVIPIVVPGVVGLMISQNIMYAPGKDSFANMIIGLFGAKPIGWFYDDSAFIVMLTVCIMGFPWGGGTTMLIYIASLQGISTEMIEATRLDGVGPFKRIIHFHLPMMVGQIKYFIITGIIAGMQNFNVQLIILRDNPDVAMVPGLLIYKYAFMMDNADYGMANAVGILLFIVILGLTLINNKFIQNKNSEEVQ